MEKIERKYMAHYLNGTPGTEAETYERIGDDLEEYSVEMGAQVDKKKNILGKTSVNISSYDKSGSVEPFYAAKGSKLFDFLQTIIDEDLTLDKVKTDMVEVKLWEPESPTSTFPAIKEEVYIEVVSYGGDTTGYQIPFNVHYTGVKTAGTFDVSTKTFSHTA